MNRVYFCQLFWKMLKIIFRQFDLEFSPGIPLRIHLEIHLLIISGNSLHFFNDFSAIPLKFVQQFYRDLLRLFFFFL